MSPRGACTQDRAAPQHVLLHGGPLAFHPLQVPLGEGPAPAHRCHWRTADLAASLSLFLYTWGPCREVSPAQWPTDRAGLAHGFPIPDPSGPQSPESAGVQPSPLSVPRKLRARARGGMLGLPQGWASSNVCSRPPSADPGPSGQKWSWNANAQLGHWLDPSAGSAGPATMPSLEFLDLEGLKDTWARRLPPGGWLKAGVLRGPGGGLSGGCPHPGVPTLSSLPAPP